MAVIGWIVGVSIDIWALSEWNDWSRSGGFGFWFSQYFWSLVVLGAIIAAIAFAVKSPSSSSGSSP